MQSTFSGLNTMVNGIYTQRLGLNTVGHNISNSNTEGYSRQTAHAAAAGIPVLVATDTASDMGPIAEANGFGYWCESNDVEEFHSNVEKMLNADLTAMGKKGWEFLLREYTTEKAYRIIMQHFESDRGAQ